MTTEEEVKALQAEVQRLSAERDMLRKLKELRLQRLKEKLANVIPQFGEKHPYLSTAASGFVQGAKQVARNVTANASKPVGEGFNTDYLVPKQKQTDEFFGHLANVYSKTNAMKPKHKARAKAKKRKRAMA